MVLAGNMKRGSFPCTVRSDIYHKRTFSNKSIHAGAPILDIISGAQHLFNKYKAHSTEHCGRPPLGTHQESETGDPQQVD